MLAPRAEGYYQLHTRVSAGGERLGTLEELIAVEAMPELPNS